MTINYADWLRAGHKSLQDFTIARALYGDFNEVIGSYYRIKKEQFKKYRDNSDALAMIRTESQIAVLSYMQGEFDEAFKFFTQSLEKMEKYPNEHSDEIFEAKCFLIYLYSRQMKKDTANKIYVELWKHTETLPVGDPKTVDFKRNLALSVMQSGELQKAFEIYMQVYNNRRDTFGEKHHVAEYSYAEVGFVLLEQGKYREALSLLERVQNTFQQEIVDDISYLRFKRYLADAHMNLGLTKIAEDLYKNSVDAMRHKYPLHPELLVTMQHWAKSLVKLNKPNEAIAVLEAVYSVRREQSPKHPDAAKTALDISAIYLLKYKDYIGTLSSFLDVPSLISSSLNWNPNLLLYSVTSIGSLFNESQDINLKEPLLKAYQLAITKQCEMRGLTDHHNELLQVKTSIGQMLITLKKSNEALEVLKDVLEKRTLVLKNDYSDCLDVLGKIANAYFALGQYVEAFEYYSEAFEIQRFITGDNTVEAVTWQSKIMEITHKKEKSVLIDAVVSNYKISINTFTDSENNVNMEKNFPLHVASETGRIAMVKFLLYKGAIYNEENSEGKTPESIACNNAIKNFFSFINGLFLAVKKIGHAEIDRKLDIMETKLRDEDFKAFPLLLKGEERIHCILDRTVLNARDESGSTPLHLACNNGDIKTVTRLLELDVDHTLTDKLNRSPRDIAEEKSFKEIVQLLESYVSKTLKDLEYMIAHKNPEMPENIMDE